MSNLHVLGWNVGGTDLYHTMRSSETGVWTPFGNVFNATGKPTDDQGAFVSFATYSCSVDDTSGDLHVCAIDVNGRLWHTIRKANAGNWSPWGSVTKETKFTGAFRGGCATSFSAS